MCCSSPGLCQLFRALLLRLDSLRDRHGVCAGTLPTEWQSMGSMAALTLAGNALQGTLPKQCAPCLRSALRWRMLM